MPFRERIKKVFKSTSPNSSVSKTSTQNGGRDERYPSNVYAPGETMPRPKYRAPPKKEHKEKLEAFSWSSAWRRKSFVSDYSPMGSRMPSRRGSLISRKSFGGQSWRKNSVSGKSGSIGGKSEAGEGQETVKTRHAARPTRLSAEIEAEGDDDVTNVGLSRVQSREAKPHSRQLSSNNVPTSSSFAKSNAATAPQGLNAAIAHDHQPFTEEDLALAMKRSRLAVPTQG